MKIQHEHASSSTACEQHVHLNSSDLHCVCLSQHACAVQFSLSDAATAEVMVAARRLSVASAKAAAEIYASVCRLT